MAKEFKVVHYNIKELDSSKLRRAQTGSCNKSDKKCLQTKAAIGVLKDLDGDLISINEMQYDKPDVPDATYHTTGLNVYRLAKLLGIDEYWTSFSEANTGENAKRKQGKYILEPTEEERLSHGDGVNFGMFPGQYSTALISRFEVISRKVYRKIQWKDFNPDIDLSIFRTATGDKLPEDIELFDKDFSDTLIKIGERELHVITYHTVPAFHFNNDSTPNYLRNRDQLAFLKWYITGRNRDRLAELKVYPLKEEATFVAMGDWNVDPQDDPNTSPGAGVILAMDSEFQFASKLTEDTYRQSELSRKWDYILTSNDIEVLQAGVVDAKQDPRVKTASDHLPIWAKLRFKD